MGTLLSATHPATAQFKRRSIIDLATIRAQIAGHTYITPRKLAVAADRMLTSGALSCSTAGDPLPDDHDEQDDELRAPVGGLLDDIPPKLPPRSVDLTPNEFKRLCVDPPRDFTAQGRPISAEENAAMDEINQAETDA